MEGKSNIKTPRLFFKVFIVLVLYSLPSFSQFPQPNFRHYTVEDGLPSSEVYHAMQDSKGYIWFATDMGVSKFNGYEFQNFNLKDGLPDNIVFNIYEDYNGRIWFISHSGKLAYYHADSIHSYKYNDQLQGRFTHYDRVYKSSFYVDLKDNVFISVYGLGYLRISQTGEITSCKHEGQASYDLIQIDSSRAFLSYSTNGELPLNLNIEVGNINMQIDMHNEIADANARIVKRRNGTYLFTARNQLIEIPDSNTFSRYFSNNSIIALKEDRQDNIWLGTFQGGVQFYKENLSARPDRTYLHGLSVSSVLQDKEGGFWFTTLERGVYYMSSNEFLT